MLILESQHVEITSAALAQLSEAGIGVMVCDGRHMPHGLLLPLEAHSRHAGIVENQLALPKPLQKRIWQRIVIQKIKNQATVLELLGKDSQAVLQCAHEVLSGDTSHREAVAASAYFKELISYGTRRESAYTAALDYGYAVLRAGVARALVSGGWLVSRGIHHDNNLNAFNLVDDFIEPFRPAVDLLVFQKKIVVLESESKHILASIFETPVEVHGEKMTIQQAITSMTQSFKHAVLEKDADKILLPQIGGEYTSLRIE